MCSAAAGAALLDDAMLAEAFVLLTSLPAAPPGFRKHLVEAVGLWSRGTRQARAWAPHIANTRGLIDTTIDDIAPRRTIAVLGSGPLFDVPLESLARTFREVLLVDRAHLATSTRRIRRYPNVRRLWRDLAGGAGRDPLGFLRDLKDLDWVVSVNLLSQLARGVPESRVHDEIVAHLEGLAALPCRATLVTDIGYRTIDQGGHVHDEVDMLRGLTLAEPDLRWKWEVAPFGEEGSQLRRVHDVAAWLTSPAPPR